MAEKIKFEVIQKYFESKGAVLLSSEYINNSQLLDFNCTKCGKPYHISWSKIRAGQNPNLLCRSCLQSEPKKIDTKLSLEDIRTLIEKAGGKLISSQVPSRNVYFSFLCSNCGREHKIQYRAILMGNNPNFLCTQCMTNAKPSISEIKDKIRQLGAEPGDFEYQNAKTKIPYICPLCGQTSSMSWNHLTQYKENKLICASCKRQAHFKPDHSYSEKCNRSRMDSLWFTLIKEFYNVDKERFSAHHLKSWGNYQEYRTSLFNGFPLRKEYHSASFEWEGIKNPFHVNPEFKDITKWPSFTRLPNRNLPLVDLNTFGMTFLISSSDSYSPNFFLNKKKELAQKGQQFIPIYFYEVANTEKREILFSILRAKIYPYFKEIYTYTGVILKKQYARKLQFKEVSYDVVNKFISENHIQGNLPASRYFILEDSEGEIWMAVSFIKPRQGTADMELLRLVTQKNSIVVGGAQKLIKNSLKLLGISSLLTYADLRFSSLNPEEVVYTRLGFTYEGITKPNYRWSNPETNQSFSRNTMQKHKLQKFTSFNPDLSEAQILEAEGFVKQWDCGSHKFIWRR